MIDNTDITVFISESFRKEDELTNDALLSAYQVILTYVATALEEMTFEDNEKALTMLKTKLIDFSHGGQDG